MILLSNRPRLRFAPSPTGYLHIGSARTVLFNWLHARRTGGEFLLRIEDTDLERNRPELVDNIYEMIEWLGLGWDGEPVHQSDRFPAYAEAARQLLATGAAYYCDCLPADVDARAKARGEAGYDGHCRDRGLEAGPGRALRFRVPDEGTTTFHDLIRGDLSFDHASLEDFVLLRSNGTPTFLLANVVDDVFQEITHVVRGEEHVNGTPKYLLIAEALGLDYRPEFAHLPVLVNKDRKKLSKRRDSVSVVDFRDKGFLPEAMVNYLALLGWGPKDDVEIRPVSEIIDLFRLEDVTLSPAFFDEKKMAHINADYIRRLDTDDFLTRVEPFLSNPAAMEPLRQLVGPIQGRTRLLADVDGAVDFLLTDEVEIDDDSWQKGVLKHGDRSVVMLDGVIGGFADVEWDADAIRSVVEQVGIEAGFVNDEGHLQLGKAQAPVRIATTGQSVGPPLFEALEVLGRDRTLERLRSARRRL